MIIISQLLGIGRFTYGLFFGDNSEERVPGKHKINGAILIGREEARKAIIITKIYGGKDGIDGNFLADLYVGSSDDTTGRYQETLYSGQPVSLTELKKYDVYACGQNAKEIAEALSEYVH